MGGERRCVSLGAPCALLGLAGGAAVLGNLTLDGVAAARWRYGSHYLDSSLRRRFLTFEGARKGFQSAFKSEYVILMACFK